MSSYRRDVCPTICYRLSSQSSCSREERVIAAKGDEKRRQIYFSQIRHLRLITSVCLVTDSKKFETRPHTHKSQNAPVAKAKERTVLVLFTFNGRRSELLPIKLENAQSIFFKRVHIHTNRPIAATRHPLFKKMFHRGRRRREQEETETDSPEVLDFRERPVYYYSATAHAQIDLFVSQLAARFQGWIPRSASGAPYLLRLSRRPSSANSKLVEGASETPRARACCNATGGTLRRVKRKVVD